MLELGSPCPCLWTPGLLGLRPFDWDWDLHHILPRLSGLWMWTGRRRLPRSSGLQVADRGISRPPKSREPTPPSLLICLYLIGSVFRENLTDTPPILQAQERAGSTCPVALPFAPTGKINRPSPTLFTAAGRSLTLLAGHCASLLPPGRWTSLPAGPRGFPFHGPPFLGTEPGMRWMPRRVAEPPLLSPVGRWGN